jgi:hypothetical protein
MGDRGPADEDGPADGEMGGKGIGVLIRL